MSLADLSARPPDALCIRVRVSPGWTAEQDGFHRCERGPPCVWRPLKNRYNGSSAPVLAGELVKHAVNFCNRIPRMNLRRHSGGVSRVRKMDLEI